MIDVMVYNGPDHMGFAYVLEHSSLAGSFPSSKYADAICFCDFLQAKGFNAFCRHREG
ncbi:hypothetical protein [Yanshouia hominis]|uniref:Uncharacterized protein n=1 Tax=Yanshouia hominis TaxID=2763673 RepID=A0ABR7NJT1_9FIRM|nr:hypothetical protein [Yanshouia hominis]MBC8576666.1 hypothetical protein [Yanshouia hominis]